MAKTDLPTGLIIGFLLIVIVFLINDRENCKKEGMDNMPSGCPACPACPVCPTCPDCPTCPENPECDDIVSYECPPAPIQECPACPSCPVYSGNMYMPTAREIANAIFPGRNSGILMSGEYFPVQDYIESCPSVLSASGTPVGATDSITTVNEPSYYKELRQYDLHGYAGTEMVESNSSGTGEEIEDLENEEDVEVAEEAVENVNEEEVEVVEEMGEVEPYSNYSIF